MKKIILLMLATMILICSCGQKAPTWQQQYDLGVRYLSEGNYEEAIIAFTAAIEIDPMRPETYLDLANAYIGQNDFDAARNILKRGYELTQDSALKARLDELEAGTEVKTLRESCYDASGALLYYHTFTYDNQNRQSSVTSFDAAGNQTGHVDISYDSKDRVLNDYWYDEETGEVGRVACEYDDVNHIKREIDYDENGEPEWYDIYQYDNLGNVTQRDDYSADGLEHDISTYQYDSQGNVTRIDEYDNYEHNGEAYTHHWYCLFSYNGNIERGDRYRDDGELLNYYITTYRDDGQEAEWCGYDSDGTQYFRDVYHYDEYGNYIGEDNYQDGQLIYRMSAN